MSARGMQVRLFLTCWLIYALHFSVFVTRETYLMMSIAERGTARLDEYAGLHSDLAEVPGRGVYLLNNPGVSLAAAPLYWMSLPIMNRIAPIRPVKPGERVTVETKEQRTLRIKFLRLARERGLDVRLAAAAGFSAVFFIAPLAALCVLLMWRVLGHMGFSEKMRMWLTLLFAFGTPIFFRAATLSLNLLVTIIGFAAFVLLWWPAGTHPEREKWRLIAAGFLCGYAVLTDYSGAITAAVFGLYAFALQWQKKGLWQGFRFSMWYLMGAAAPVIYLLYWQWACYGNPWLPGQFYLPKELLVGLYENSIGVGGPKPIIFWDLLFDPLYGLLVFAPVFGLAVVHFVLVWRGESRLPKHVTIVTWAFFAALMLFLSCIHYTIRHQWQDGVRYIVPVVPFLFLLVAEVMARLPRALAWPIGVICVIEMWCLAMVREYPLECLRRVFITGPELPWLTTLVKTAAQYAPSLQDGASPFGLFLVTGLAIWVLWRARNPWTRMNDDNRD